MCRAFSCIVTQKGKVYWIKGKDSHEDIIEHYKHEDNDLRDDNIPPNNTFARIEIVPPDGDYLNLKQKWEYQIDERIKPSFLTDSYEGFCREEFEKWKKQVYTFNIKEAKNPVNPFALKPPKITKKHIALVKQWASVRDSVWDSVGASVRDSVRDSVGDSVGDSVWDSVGDSVGDSVWASVGDSVRASVWDSVWDSVWASVWASVGAYIGSLFPIKKLKQFAPAVELWKLGLVPSFDGKLWRLHGGKDAKILWEGKF